MDDEMTWDAWAWVIAICAGFGAGGYSLIWLACIVLPGL